MSKQQLLHRLAIAYIAQKKKPHEAYDLALKVILEESLSKERELDYQLNKLKRRGEL